MGVSQVALEVKNPPANAGDMRLGFNPWIGKIPWRRAWQPTPVILPGESYGQRSLAGYSLVHGVTKSQMQLKQLMYRTVFWTLGEGEGGMIWKNGIETCKISYKK